MLNPSVFRYTAAAISIAIYTTGVQANVIPVATYVFNNSLSAIEQSAPSLVAIDPLGKNAFETDNVFGVQKTVYKFDGDSASAKNAGLSLDTRSILDNNDSYSVEMVFKFNSNDSSWEQIFGVSNRRSDNAFYVDPSDKLEVYPSGDGAESFTFGEYHHVTLTNDGNGNVTSYLDGKFQFDLTTSSMDFSAYSLVNSERLIHFFTDNIAGGGQNEFADGAVSLIRIYDVDLSADEVNDLSKDPAVIPVPAAAWLFGSALLGLAGLNRKMLVVKSSKSK